MNIDLSENCAEIAARLRAVGEKAPVVARKGVIDARAVMFAGSRGLLSQLIYNVAIPQVSRRKRNKGGKLGRRRLVPLWKRTSQLLRGEKQPPLADNRNELVAVVDNDTPYAAFREQQTKRPAHWRTRAVQEYEPSARAAFQAALDALTK